MIDLERINSAYLDPDRLIGECIESYLLRYLRKAGLATKETESRIFSDPLTHEGSDALYYADYYIGKNRILVGGMPAFSKSTRHYHRDPLVEEYRQIAGQLYVNREPIPPNGLIVRPFTGHQASTLSSPALTLIIMHNAGIFPEDSQHIKC